MKTTKYRILNTNCRKIFESKEKLLEYINNTNIIKPYLYSDDSKSKLRISCTTYSEELIDFTHKIDSLTSEDKIIILNALKNKIQEGIKVIYTFYIPFQNHELIKMIDELLKLDMTELIPFKLCTNYKPCNSVGLIIPEKYSTPFLPKGYVKRNVYIGYRCDDITWGDDNLIGRNVSHTEYEATISDFQSLLK